MYTQSFDCETFNIKPEIRVFFSLTCRYVNIRKKRKKCHFKGMSMHVEDVYGG